jgi:hypothetical protein
MQLILNTCVRRTHPFFFAVAKFISLPTLMEGVVAFVWDQILELPRKWLKNHSSILREEQELGYSKVMRRCN